MNSRERVLCALNHRRPDRVPIDLGGTRQSGIAASTYHQLKERLGIRTPTRVYDVYQMLAEVERPVMERFGADCIGLCRPAVAFEIRNEGWKPWRLFDGTPVEVPGGFNPVTDEKGDLLLYGPDGGKGDKSNLCEAPSGRAPAEGWSRQNVPVPFFPPASWGGAKYRKLGNMVRDSTVPVATTCGSGSNSSCGRGASVGA
jgi:hypothetical protein